jgi:hypothetical protein
VAIVQGLCCGTVGPHAVIQVSIPNGVGFVVYHRAQRRDVSSDGEACTEACADGVRSADDGSVGRSGEGEGSHRRSEEILRGHWSGTIPGRGELAAGLGMNTTTVEAALKQLEKEGLLVGQGAGRRRKIELPEELAKPPGLRVAILCYEQGDQTQNYLIHCKNKLEAAGHTVFYAPSHLTELKMDVRRLGRMVKKTEADAWVELGGTREVLGWFMQQKIPAFADSGRRRKLKIAGIGRTMFQPSLRPRDG